MTKIISVLFISLLCSVNQAHACGGGETSLEEFSKAYSGYLIGKVWHGEIVMTPAYRCIFQFEIKSATAKDLAICENKVQAAYSTCQDKGISEECAQEVASCFHACPESEFLAPDVWNRSAFVELSSKCEAIRQETNDKN